MEILAILPQVGPVGAPTGALPDEPAGEGGTAPFCFWPKTLDWRLPGGTTAADNGQAVPFCPGPEPFMHFAALPPAIVFPPAQGSAAESTGPPQTPPAKSPILPPWLAAALAAGQPALVTSTAPGDPLAGPRIAGAVLAFDGAALDQTETQIRDLPGVPAGLQELLDATNAPGWVVAGETASEELPPALIPDGVETAMHAPTPLGQSVSGGGDSAPASVSEASVWLGPPVRRSLPPVDSLDPPPVQVSASAPGAASSEAPPKALPANVLAPVPSATEMSAAVPPTVAADPELESTSLQPPTTSGQPPNWSGSQSDGVVEADSHGRPERRVMTVGGAPGGSSGAASAIPPSLMPPALTVSPGHDSLLASEAAKTAATVSPAAAATAASGPTSDTESGDGMQAPRGDLGSSSGPGVTSASGRTEGTGRPALPSALAVHAADFADRLARTLLDTHQAGRPLSVRLHPPELGLLQIELSSREGVFTARMDVETPAARQTILDQLPQLREALAQTGHTIERIDVQVVDRQEHRSEHHDRRESGHQPPRDDTPRERQRPAQRSDGRSNEAQRPHLQPRPASLDRLDIQI
jgi:hypothetical protein